MVKTTERGWVGHFICGDRCLFRRNTLIEGKGDSVVVSTVGAFRNGDGVIEEIGVQRYYETMVFGSKKEGGYIEADVGDERDVESEWAICAKSYQDLPEDVDNRANDMHETVVSEFVEKLNAGE